MTDDDILTVFEELMAQPRSSYDPYGHLTIKNMIAIASERGKENYFASALVKCSEYENVLNLISKVQEVQIPLLFAQSHSIPSTSETGGFQHTDEVVPESPEETDTWGVVQERPSLPAGKEPCGLVNQGNTCYINSALQILFALEPFWSLLLRLPVKKEREADQATNLLFQMKQVFFLSSFFFLLGFSSSSNSSLILMSAAIHQNEPDGRKVFEAAITPNEGHHG